MCIRDRLTAPLESGTDTAEVVREIMRMAADVHSGHFFSCMEENAVEHFQYFLMCQGVHKNPPLPGFNITERPFRIDTDCTVCLFGVHFNGLVSDGDAYPRMNPACLLYTSQVRISSMTEVLIS